MAKEEYHFERLTPINAIELKVYEDALAYLALAYLSWAMRQQK